jgi:hypothetical protein
MRPCNRTARTEFARVALLLIAVFFAPGAFTASPTLQSIAVTPADKTILVGQKQLFTATGTFSDGSTHALRPAIADIAPGFAKTCVVLISGGVECWGNDAAGRGSPVASPVKGITTATAARYGYYHGCALLAGGMLQCWGENGAGQLGNGSTGAGPLDVAITVLGINTATTVSVGWAHSCARLVSGEVQCWGDDWKGQLGHGGSGAWSSVPIPVSGIGTATAVSAGLDHSCALLSSGSVQCWGWNIYGQLGNGTEWDSTTPVTVVGISNATAIASSDYFNCALLATGAVQCWGDNSSGELGGGTIEGESRIPVTVPGISTATAITAGGKSACAVLRSGFVKCWGDNTYGQLGNGTTTIALTPVRDFAVNAPTTLAAGWGHACALFGNSGAMKCWGKNDAGQLGIGRIDEKPHPWPLNVIGTPGVVWQSSDPTKAPIGPRGWATGRAVGNTTITATTAGFINDNAVLTVK